MKYPEPFSFWVDGEELDVRFVSEARLGYAKEGHQACGDYRDLTIRLLRYETRGVQRSTLLHELAHYLMDRTEFSPRSVIMANARRGQAIVGEIVANLVMWLSPILVDPRNGALRAFLGLAVAA